MSIISTITYIKKLHPKKIEKFKNIDVEKKFSKSKLLKSISNNVNTIRSRHCEKSMIRMLIECQRRLYFEDICNKYGKIEYEKINDKFWKKEYYKSIKKIRTLKNRNFLKYNSQLKIIIPLIDFIDYEKYNIKL